MILTLTIGLVVAVIAVIIVLCAFAWYRVVPPTEAHLVVTPSTTMIASSDPLLQKDCGSSYFAIPPIPIIGRRVRVMDVTIKEISGQMETYEKDQARYMVDYSVKYRIADVRKAADTFINDQELQKQANDQIISAVRAVTVKYSVVDARANKQKMAVEVRNEIQDDFANWGLNLVMFSLVDFQDTETSTIISSLSKRREVEIETDTRQQNAEKFKNARFKEAEAEENAKKREIEKEQNIAAREQEKLMKVAEQQRTATEKQLDVTWVQQVKTQEIERDRAIVEATQKKDVEEIIKQQKQLVGEGDQKMKEAQAKGAAATTREEGYSQAAVLDKKQEALNKFGNDAIRALVAEKVVDMQQAVGVATAKALESADLKVFAGNSSGASGFDIGQLITATSVSNQDTADAVLNKLARPNDLGLAALSTLLNKRDETKKKEGIK